MRCEVKGLETVDGNENSSLYKEILALVLVDHHMASIDATGTVEISYKTALALLKLGNFRQYAQTYYNLTTAL